jgi:cytochrome P450
LYYKLRNKKYLKGIPIVKEQNLFLGLAKLLMPIDGSLDSHQRLEEMALKYGPICQFYVLWNHVIHITDGNVAKQIYDQAKDKGVIHRHNRIPRVKNIFSLNTSDDWKQRRQKFRHAFTHASLKGYSNLMNGMIKKLLQKLKTSAQNQEKIKLDAIFSRFALDAIFHLGFEMDLDFLNNETLFEEINTAVLEFFQLTWLNNIPFLTALVTSPLPLPSLLERYRKAFYFLRSLRRKVLTHLQSKYQTKSYQSDCFGKLFMEFIEEQKGKITMTQTDIESEIMVVILAGHETTAHSLSFFFYAFCKNPHIQDQCREALRQSSSFNTLFPHLSSNTASNNTLKSEEEQIQPNKPTYPFSMLAPLPDYLEATLKESMRLYPVAARGSLRMSLESSGMEFEYHNQRYHIPSDTILHVNIYSLQRSKSNWGDNANEFHPERWLHDPMLLSPASFAGTAPSTNTTKSSSQHHATAESIIFAPFAAGPRNCIGMNFALWEIRSVILGIVSQFTISMDGSDAKTLFDESQALQTDMLTMKILNQLPVRLTYSPLISIAEQQNIVVEPSNAEGK